MGIQRAERAQNLIEDRSTAGGRMKIRRKLHNKPRQGATVRVDSLTKARLDELAEQLDMTVQDVIALTVDRFRRQRILQVTAQAYAELRTDPKQWRAELAERAIWDQTLADGLEPEDWSEYDDLGPDDEEESQVVAHIETGEVHAAHSVSR